jgi:hypothetical protein
MRLPALGGYYQLLHEVAAHHVVDRRLIASSIGWTFDTGLVCDFPKRAPTRILAPQELEDSMWCAVVD